MFEEHINPDGSFAGSGSKGHAVEQIGLLFVQVIGNEGAVVAFGLGEVELFGDLIGEQLDQAAQVLFALQQPEHASVGELADRRLVKGWLVGCAHQVSLRSSAGSGLYIKISSYYRPSAPSIARRVGLGS